MAGSNAGSGYLQAHNTVNQIITALENMTDPLEIDQCSQFPSIIKCRVSVNPLLCCGAGNLAGESSSLSSLSSSLSLLTFALLLSCVLIALKKNAAD